MAWVLMGGLDLRVPSEVPAAQAPGRSCPRAALLILAHWPPCPACGRCLLALPAPSDLGIHGANR